MHLCLHSLFLQLLVLSLQLHLLVFHVPSSLHNNVCGPFPGFIYLSNRLKIKLHIVTYFSLFRFQKTYAVAQQLQVFFRSLSGQFCRHKFSVKSRIVVIFVWREVDFLLALIVIL